MSGTSWLLGGGYPWQSGRLVPADDASSTALVESPVGGLSLPTLPTGPLGLESPDGSLGRLALPRGVAVDGNTVLILSADGDLVWRYDPVGPSLVPLANVGRHGVNADAAPGWEREARRFARAASIAAFDGTLYVADPAASRVQVMDLATLALIRIHEGIEVVDVAPGGRGVYVADARGQVFLATPRRDVLRRLRTRPVAGAPLRIVVDRTERVYLLLKESNDRPALHQVYPQPAAVFPDAASVRDRFDPARVTADKDGTLDLATLADPCGIRSETAAATRRTVGPLTYRIDTETRQVLVFHADGRLRHRFGPLGADGAEVAAHADDHWAPVDVAGLGACALILDARYRAVYAHQLGAETLRTWFIAPSESTGVWRRIAVDPKGCLLLWDGRSAKVERFDQRGAGLGTVELRAVRRYFSRAEPEKLAFVPPRMSRSGLVPRERPDPPSWPLQAFRTRGTFVSRWLDSGVYNCQWHAIELSLASLPPGSSITIRTRTSDTPGDQAAVLAALAGSIAGSWSRNASIASPAQRTDAPPMKAADVLVLSGPGQYLQLMIELESTGLDTPVIGSARITFPRDSLLEYLPAIYSAPEEQREFLDRFLAVFQATWAGIEREVETFERYLDPDSVPDEGMAFLAKMLGVRLEGTWTPEQNRRLLQAMPGLIERWGTPTGLREWLRVYLGVKSGLSDDDLPESLPGLVEGFVERRRLMLGRQGAAQLGSAEGLWSHAVERRLQIGVFDQAGEVAIVSDGDPTTDLFRHHAHHFRVYVPAVWVRTPDDEALLRRAIDLQRPAHTTYELVLVEARFRVGTQSILDLDTIISAPPEGRLACARTEDASGRPPYQRLGMDTQLAPGQSASALGRPALILA